MLPLSPLRVRRFSALSSPMYRPRNDVCRTAAFVPLSSSPRYVWYYHRKRRVTVALDVSHCCAREREWRVPCSITYNDSVRSCAAAMRHDVALRAMTDGWCVPCRHDPPPTMWCIHRAGDALCSLFTRCGNAPL
jgi:hypothetical protein